MQKVYDYENNTFRFKRKNDVYYDLNLRGNITIIDGFSGNGKTVLFDDIIMAKNNTENIVGTDMSNITPINSSDTEIEDKKVLYIIDRADKILNNNLCDKICSCNYARFLIFARGSFPLGVSPNHIGTFVRNDNCITIEYDFNESWW